MTPLFNGWTIPLRIILGVSAVSGNEKALKKQCKGKMEEYC
jgi:hypothetical protein